MKAKKQPRITATMLAKDVLKWLKPATRKEVRLVPAMGTGYVRLLENKASDPLLNRDFGADGDLQTFLLCGKPCQVCGIGAFLVAKALRVDAIRAIGGGVSRERCVASLKPVGLGEDALFYIEQAFECGTGLRSNTATGRLKEICRNIIANKGKFIPKGAAK